MTLHPCLGENGELNYLEFNCGYMVPYLRASWTVSYFVDVPWC